VSDQQSEPGPDEPAADGERVGESLRTAVARTLAATAGSASDTGHRARDLLDEVARRGESARAELGRRGAAARDEVVRRGEAAREGVSRRRDAARDDLARRSEEAGARLADALAELKLADRGEPAGLTERLSAVERRLDLLERRVGGGEREQADSETGLEGPPNPKVEGERSPDATDAQADSDA
jgi:polyhydroxyalkanoate synthesis regulator phasin